MARLAAHEIDYSGRVGRRRSTADVFIAGLGMRPGATVMQ
jgi:hypothetical protein